MTIIADLPEEIRSVLAANPEQAEKFWEWVSQVHYAQVVAQAGKAQPLVAIKARFDFAAIESVCAAYRRYAGGRGVDATHSVRQLCYGVVVKAFYNWSYAKTAQEVRSNSLLRWFVGYRLDQETFAPVTLWRFEAWLKESHPRLLFTEVLKQIDEDFPDDAQAAQVGDTFALVSRAREQSRTELLRDASRRLLRALEQVAPQEHQRVLMQMTLDALFGTATDQREWGMNKAERDAREERTALAALHMLECVRQVQTAVPPTQDILYLCLVRWQGIVAKVLQTFAQDDQGDQGVWVKATVRTKHVKGSYVIGSAVDPEATFRQHGDQCDLCYNVSVAATRNFIRETCAATGAKPDSQGVAPLLTAQKQHLGLLPPKLIYDRAAGMPKIFAEVDKASAGATQLVARLVDYNKARLRFGPQDFTLGLDGQLTCPNGQTSGRFYRSPAGDGWTYRFAADQCQGCPLRAPCRSDKVKPDAFRQVFISVYVDQQRQALRYLSTAAFRQDMRLRPAIERIIAALVRYNGARRATGYGLANADYQARMAALAFNLKRWALLSYKRNKPKRTAPEPDTA